MAVHLLLIPAFCLSFASVQASDTKLVKDFVALDQTYVPALALTKMEKAKPAMMAMKKLNQQWQAFQSQQGDTLQTDQVWQKALASVDAQIREASKLVAMGKYLFAHESLEEVRAIFRKARRDSGMTYYLDYLTDFHDVMEEIVKPNMKRTPDQFSDKEMAETMSLTNKAVEAWKTVRKAEFDAKLFGFDEAKEMQRKKLIQAESKALSNLQDALKKGDKKEILKSAVAIKPGFAKLFMLFGNFPQPPNDQGNHNSTGSKERRVPIEIGKFKGFVIPPTIPAQDGRRPWVWYAPTIGAHPNKNNQWVLQQLLDKGFYVCGIDVGESYGSPNGTKVYNTFYDRIVKQFKLDPKASLLAQSRGGLMLYNWAAENPNKVRCIVGIYPVCDLRSYPGLQRPAPAFQMTAAELDKQLSQHNPIDRLKSLADAGISILHIHGDSDRVVPLKQNSQVVFDRYRALGGKMELIVVPGKGHAEIPEFFQEPRLVQFLLNAHRRASNSQ